MVRRAGVAACLAAALMSTSAQAAELDEFGKLSMSADVEYGFETVTNLDATALVGEDYLDVYDYIVEQEVALQGRHALQVAGKGIERVWLDVDSLPGIILKGRRVEITLWTRSHLTDVSPRLVWFNGEASVERIRLQPTGRRSSDGWREWTTGAFDWAIGGSIEPDSIYFEDQTPEAIRGEVADEAYTFVDAVEIRELGAAAVEPNGCTIASEADVCGEMGLCLYGVCTDGAPIVGAVPPATILSDYIERLIERNAALLGARISQERLGEVAERWRALVDERSPRRFWRELSDAHSLLLDGHGSAPRHRYLTFQYGRGLCLGPGVADLLPGRTPDALMPMVFYTSDEIEDVSVLEPGDVLVEVDGVEVWDWLEANRDVFYYQGDPVGRDAMIIRDIAEQAIEGGSQLTFERCALEAGCEAGEVERVTLDTSAWTAPYWDGEPLEHEYTDFFCDQRFAPLARAEATDDSSWVEWGDVDGVRQIVFDGFPSVYGSSGAGWAEGFEGALADDPDRVLIDQRTGFGGYVSGLTFLAGLFLQAANRVEARSAPWIGGESERADASARSCFEVSGEQGDECGGFSTLFPDERAEGASARLALVSGYDVSSNDYFAHWMTFRQAPTRQFGYGPTVGGFGTACQMPPMLDEPLPSTYQCDDTFYIDRFLEEGDYISGVGVSPDELVYQRQSDAIVGVDTALARATEWLEDQGD